MRAMNRRDAVEALSAIVGHGFADRALAEAALTHPSLAGRPSYQRLEFLGDRVLGLCVAEMVYSAFPDVPEGVLNRRYAALVRKESLAEVARTSGLQPLIQLESGAETEGAREQPAVLEDVCEAVIGAIFLDGGLAPAKAFVERTLGPRLAEGPSVDKDAKTALQEWAQKRRLALPVYQVIGRTGPDHAPRFRVRVSVGEEEPAEAEATSKRQAEQAAAHNLLSALGLGGGSAEIGS
ncbi:ribonuclease III [Rhodothalassium salexigens DSM 2132]|nr:ribonuclease III [Rhodothalassium salexigens DSM 2132]